MEYRHEVLFRYLFKVKLNNWLVCAKVHKQCESKDAQEFCPQMLLLQTTEPKAIPGYDGWFQAPAHSKLSMQTATYAMEHEG